MIHPLLGSLFLTVVSSLHASWTWSRRLNLIFNKFRIRFNLLRWLQQQIRWIILLRLLFSYMFRKFILVTFIILRGDFRPLDLRGMDIFFLLQNEIYWESDNSPLIWLALQINRTTKRFYEALWVTKAGADTRLEDRLLIQPLVCSVAEGNKQASACFCIYTSSCIFDRCPKLACFLLIPNSSDNRAAVLVKLYCILKQVEKNLAVYLFLNKEGDWDTCMPVDLCANVALFYRNMEWLKHVFDDFSEFGARALNVVYLSVVILNLHLRKLGLNVVFEQFARTPDDLHWVFLFWTHRFIFKKYFRNV